MDEFEIVVIGGGIAGLATAEIFSRSGFKVLLVEKNSKLCSETSGLHHEWFHFGSLYSIFLTNQFLRTMIRGIGDLLVYYQDFEGMNLRINESGKLLTVDNENGWFRNDKLQYVITNTSHPEFNLSNYVYLSELYKKVAMRILWNMIIKQFIARHNHFYEYDWRKNCANFHIPNFSLFDCSNEYVSNFSNINEINLNPIFHKSMESYDCPMNAYSIISDLTKNFLSNKGEILTDVMFEKHQKLSDKVLVKLSNNQSVKTKKLILSSGTHLKNYAEKLKLRIIASPLLVAYPAVCSVNFVRLTPFVSHTINHIRHNINGKNYSLIGGGYFALGDDEKACKNAEASLSESAKSVFPALDKARLIKTYSGHKTEMSGSLKNRNYLYHIEEIEKDVFVILPAKFSLAFSLAVNAFNKITGRLPEKRIDYDKSLCVSNYVTLMKHKAIVKEFYETNQN